ncbi:MAG: aminopeptidase P family protein [Solirubrobacteraceae bacterium]
MAETGTVSGTRRMREVAEALRERSVDALVVTAPANVRYLSGYTGSSGLLAVAAQSAATAPDLFVTDFRYETQAAAEVGGVAPGCEILIAKGDLLEAAAEALSERAGAAGGRASIGFEERHLTFAQHGKLAELLGEDVELVACAGIIERLREVKDAEEQERIAAAARLADEALSLVLEGGLAGRRERDVAIDLETRMRRLGAESPSFPSIVASGAQAALPHGRPRDVEIERGTLVTIDWGAVLDGYCSDCTRTYAVGEPSGLAAEVHALVLEAQLAGVAALAPGRSGREVDAVAREVIETAGRGERFGHGLGHGVGLEVHEGPRLSRLASEDPLREGAVVTVEPGVYLPDELGVRIEDLLVVSSDGARNLSSLSKELTVL